MPSVPPPGADHPVGRPFSGAVLDRASVPRKDPEWVAEGAADPAARGIAAGRDEVLVDGEGPAARLARVPMAATALADPILLGLDEAGTGLFAVDLDREPAADDGSWGQSGGPARPIGLRDAGAELPHAEAGLAAYAVALLNWHRRHRFCANCGALTEIAEAGFERRCPACGAHHFPRTDPVVIMSVESEGRLLLGRRAGWPAGRLSVLAGFISPGESAEEAVVREVQEESGVVVRDPRYVTSQPWPFPASLMLGFHAISDGGEPHATDGELDEVRWVTTDEVRAAIAGDTAAFQMPGSVSIAHHLIERWAAGQPA